MDIMTFFNGFHFKSEFWVLILPISLMAIDIVSGLLYAWASRSFKSKKMRSGLTKKVGEIMILVIGELLAYGMTLPGCLMPAISAYIILMEIMSVFENLKKMGVTIPAFISKTLNTVDDILKEEDVSQAVKKVAELEKEVEKLKAES